VGNFLNTVFLKRVSLYSFTLVVDCCIHHDRFFFLAYCVLCIVNCFISSCLVRDSASRKCVRTHARVYVCVYVCVCVRERERRGPLPK
jgi:hypothetical protein